MRAFTAALGLTLASGCANSCGEGEVHKTSQGFQVTMPADARAVFESAESLEIFATAPEASELLADASGSESELFHGHRIVAHALVDDPRDRKALIEALLGGIAQHRSTMVACNEPRHGFRATRGSDNADIHMSFGCLHGTAFTKAGRATVLTAASGKRDIDKLFAKYKVPSGK